MTTDIQAMIPVLGDVPVQPEGNSPATFSAFNAEKAVAFVRKYDPKAQEVPGYRHAVIRYRDGKDGKASKPADMVTVPQLDLDPLQVVDQVDNETPITYTGYFLPDVARKLFLEVLCDAQDDMIRGMIISGKSAIHWETITLDKILTDMSAVRVSKRLTKEGIEQWVKAAMTEWCLQRGSKIAEAKGLKGEEIEKQKQGTLTAYVNNFAKLSAPVPNLSQKDAESLQAALISANLADDMATVLKGKLHAILHPDVVENGNL